MSLEEEDASLKDLVTKTLQSNGVLGKIQAQLRASVFLALEEEFKQKNIPLINKWAQQLLSSREGTLAAALVQDFLQCLGLEFSLAVFTPESGQSAYWSFPGRQNVQSNLKLHGENGQRVPLLLELVKERQSGTQADILQSERFHDGNSSSFGKNNSDSINIDAMLSSDHFTKPATQQINLITHPLHHISSPMEDSSDNSLSEHSSHKSLQSLEQNIYKTSSQGFFLNKRSSEDLHQGKLEPLETNNKKGGLNSNGSLPSWADGKLGARSLDLNEDVTAKSCDTPIPKLPLGAEVDDQKDTPDSSLSGCGQQYSEDFSSMSEKLTQDEEDIDEAEDIDEDISLDDLLSSNASLGSEHTKDQSVSAASDVPNYQEDL